jgi:hypothetical protein
MKPQIKSQENGYRESICLLVGLEVRFGALIP